MVLEKSLESFGLQGDQTSQFQIKLEYSLEGLMLMLIRKVKVTHLFLFATLYSPWNYPAHNTGVGSLYLLQRIILTQELNQDILHHKQIPYQLNYQENPNILMLKLKL